MSSIFRMLRTVSLARVTALVLTSRGCTTFSSRMLVMAPFLTLIPAVFSPWACLFLSSVTVPEIININNKTVGHHILLMATAEWLNKYRYFKFQIAFEN